MDEGRRVRGAVALGALAVLAAACSVSITDNPETGAAAGANDGGGAAAGPDFSGAPVRGVTDDTIRLGAAAIDDDLIRDTYGVDIGNIPREAMPALVEATNEAGGINGRQVELVTRYFMPIGNEPSEQACRELIEDEQVFAVLGSFLADNPMCVTETYATPYIGLWGLNTERHQRSQAPFITADAEEEDGLGASVELLIEQGALDGSSVGIYYEPGTTAQAIDERVIAPLEEAGVEVVGSAQLSNNGGDAVQAGNEIDRFLERFRSDGADTVLFASGIGVVLPALERTSWEPQLVFVNNGQILGYEAVAGYGNTDPSELAGAIGAVNGQTSDEKAADEDVAECFAIVDERTDLDVGPDDVYTAEERPGSQDLELMAETCRLWDLAVEVLEAAGDDPTPQSLLEGLDTLGDVDLMFNPGSSLSRQRWGAIDQSRLWRFDEETVTFVPDEGAS